MVEQKTQTEFKYMCNTVKNLDMVRVFFKREDANQRAEDQSTSIETQDKKTGTKFVHSIFSGKNK